MFWRLRFGIVPASATTTSKRSACRHTVAMDQKKPGNLIAAWWNIIICGGIIMSAAWFAVTNSPFGFLVAGVGIAMEIFFVRVLLEIRKERASASRMPEDRGQDEDGADDDSTDGRDSHS